MTMGSLFAHNKQRLLSSVILLLTQGGEDAVDGGGADPFQDAMGGTGIVNTRIADRESEYHKRRLARPVREDGMSFKDAMQHATLDRERHELVQEARKEFLDDDGNLKPEAVGDSSDAKPARRRRRRWDDSSAGKDPATTPLWNRTNKIYQ
jgi:hypothetical protein